MKFLVTGGAGFIGSAFIRLLLGEPDGSRHGGESGQAHLCGKPREPGDGRERFARYRFVHGDICDAALVNSLVAEEKPDVIVNFAAESHVDRSILSPAPVFETNLRGTFTLLEAARTHQTPRYMQISTDEVYGSIDPPHEADENYPLRASSPYSASKAGADLLALSYFVTYKMPVTRDPGLEQLRSLPVSGKTHPADDFERPGEQAFADLRRRPADPRLVVRGRSCPGHPGGDRARPGRGDLQHRRQPRAAEPRRGAQDPGRGRKTGKPDADGEGSPRARPPVRSFQRETDARNRLDKPRFRSKTVCARPSNGTGRMLPGQRTSRAASIRSITRATTAAGQFKRASCV